MDDESAQLLACIPRLRRYARALAGDRAAADDLVQDTLERAWRKMGSWRRGSDMRAWLFGIMHNLYIDHTRKRSRESAEEAVDELLSTRASQSDRLEVRDLDAALRLLPSEQREVVLLVAIEEMTYDEVAKTLGIPPGTVMSRLARGREKLRAITEGRPLISPLKVVK
ncbi:RNA polymerase sigma factor [Noviherbaspirillum massiliense]|uniref:RNA polymerase sigma factor n=1 Tax=Noviherbaspirillum massiliense TaxID=1465823 RepID=UPI000307B4E6|nr:RNA polymerase sigma factor [Noviherbaspirillum massiliense]